MSIPRSGLVSLITLVGCSFTAIDIVTQDLCASTDLPEKIPDTDLQTYTYYRVRFLTFQNGTINWGDESHSSGGRYVTTDNAYDYVYDRGDMFRKHGQYYFIPLRFGSDLDPSCTGWYKLVNRGIPGEYATISADGDENGYGPRKHYVLLDGNFYPGFTSVEEVAKFLWKPVKKAYNGRYYHQLQVKAVPTGVVTWTEKEYKRNKKYLYLDNTQDKRFQRDNDKFPDTLLTFEKVDD